MDVKNKNSGEDKINQICEKIRHQTLEPAKKLSSEIIENAKVEAAAIIAKANEEKDSIIANAEAESVKLENSTKSSIKSASLQIVDNFKQELENSFFTEEIKNLLNEKLNDSDIIFNLIKSLIEAVEKEGTSSDFSLYISKNVPKEKLTKFLGKTIIDKLKEKEIIEKDFSGGAKIKLNDKQITLDISTEALTELLAGYIRKDLRKLIFNL